MRTSSLLKWVIRMFLRLYHRVEVIGMEKFPREGAALIVGNHISYIDPFYIGSMLPRHVHFMAKAEAWRFRITKFFLDIFQAFPVNREKADIQAIRTALRYLEEKKLVGLFPEGGIREDVAPLQEVKQGAAFLSIKANAPVVPIYLSGSEKALPVGKIWIRPSKIRIIIGDLILVPEAGTFRERQEYLSQQILQTLLDLRKSIEQMD
ncbi:lysophospholipid acyltransferase family protein [Baia soyae]|uniref:1-acyl-sn-glycerol-3-phosphate acyltransferase n=1 Tax=Baia soyae TaxID=1544746 RepID=A0A4R2S331_9BACL|nr:lysophospholipid acyltransferase family protein [Baia soyae]TCP70256.1 1-acyl-sn-glycerol-3-phosphate acyltransferase [Baia soyae]